MIRSCIQCFDHAFNVPVHAVSPSFFILLTTYYLPPTTHYLLLTYDLQLSVTFLLHVRIELLRTYTERRGERTACPGPQLSVADSCTPDSPLRGFQAVVGKPWSLTVLLPHIGGRRTGPKYRTQ